MQNLPKIYQNINIKNIPNNKEMCVVEDRCTSNESIRDTLKKVYAGLGEKYNTKVRIETDNNVYDTTLIYKSEDRLITRENSVIDVKDIRNITIKK